jgi:hypothetical protein
LKCCDHLQNVHSLHLNAEELTSKIRRICHKTKRLNRIRYSHTELNIEIKEEPSTNIHHHHYIPIEHVNNH